MSQGLGQRGEVLDAQGPDMAGCPQHSHRPRALSGCGAVCEGAGPGCHPGTSQPWSPGPSASGPAQPPRQWGAPTPAEG